MNDYKQLEAWKQSRALVKSIYETTSSFPQNEIYGLVSQIRRASVSILSNIAEGIGRDTSKETVHFLYMSRGSAYEVESQLFVCFDLNFIKENALNELLELINSIKRLVNGLIKRYKSL
jgi:four helix bundle protein